MRIGFVPEAEEEELESLDLGGNVGQGYIQEEDEEEEEREPTIYVEIRLGPWTIQWRVSQ